LSRCAPKWSEAVLGEDLVRCFRVLLLRQQCRSIEELVPGRQASNLKPSTRLHVARRIASRFAQAMRRHGVPQEVLTDNGKVFTGRFGAKDAEVLFDRICRENGIDHC
jgi:hypothetical protein